MPVADEMAKEGALPAGTNIDTLCIDTIRTLSMDAVQKAKSGHPGTPMALAPVAYTLWQDVLRYDPQDPSWPNRDRFVLSVGHASMLLYSLLHLSGVRRLDQNGPTEAEAVSLDDIKQFRQLSSVTPGHPEYSYTSGVETTTGPLGQGVANSVGMAMAQRWFASRYNTPDFALYDYRIYAICGDGDMMEGVSSEAASTAGHLKLSNLVWIYDSNHITIEGATSLAFSEDVGARFEGYGWHVLHLDDANDTAGLTAALREAEGVADRPTLIVVHSIIGYGAPKKQGTREAHGEPLGDEEIRAAKRFYGWPEDAQFLVPPGVREHFDKRMGARGARLRHSWMDMLARYRTAHPDLARELDQMDHHHLPEGWDADIPAFPADAKGLASRESSQKVLNAIGPRLPWLVGGAADLAPSTKSNLTFEGAGSFEAGAYGGRNLHFGIREHAMGSICNGMALSGIRPYGSGFLIFSDYMKPPIRLAAIMELPVIYIFTHDSIGVGEDGPTHQPVEQLIALRAIPGVVVIRPADANEVAEAWRVALGSHDKPVALILSRQALPTIDRAKFAAASGLARGAYAVADCEGEPQVILIGTGSEVQLCMGAHEALAAEGIRARVVSMPSWELFESQDQAYRDSVLPPGVAGRVVVEQGSSMGWDRYALPGGAVIAMHTFGASAPAAALQKKFGFTPEAVLEAARKQAKKGGQALSAVSRPDGVQADNPLKRLEAFGQSPWLDFIQRSFIGPKLETLIERDGLKGITSNPAIFQKAMGEGTDYDAGFQTLAESGDHDALDIYEALAVDDIRAASDMMMLPYIMSGKVDGYVSLEVSPYLALRTEDTVAEARRLWKWVGRDNLMVKVPGTDAGVPAVRTLISEGLNINVTLLFALSAYEAVAESYIAGLEDRLARGESVAGIASVASFFVSRIDAMIDKKIDERMKNGESSLASLRGKVAIANAKVAYQHYLSLLSSPRWERLAAAGAQPQRLLWASTGVKDKAYSDVLYVEELIGRDTVNTIPPATMDAFRDHGKLRESLTEDVEGARMVLYQAEMAGLDLDGVTLKLVADGVELFAEAADKLLGSVSAKRTAMLGGDLVAVASKLPNSLSKPVAEVVEDWRKSGKLRDLWAGDAQVWTDTDEAKWLGWLRVVDDRTKALPALQKFQNEIKAEGFQHVLLLGMGGSSLGPEVLAETFGKQPGFPELLILDSTDPAQIAALRARVDLARTLCIVSSKSGSTLEPNIFKAYFWEEMKKAVGDKAPRHFVAVTDPGSKLQHAAEADGFRQVFMGDPSIGGRYSVLSNFGMVPAAAMGLDLGAFLKSAALMVRSCAAGTPPLANPGVQLGAILGVAAKAGRDKVTIVASPGLADVGAWLEQLLAESTGKQGHGIVPVDSEPLGPPAVYGQDRLFAYLRLEGHADPAQEAAMAALESAGQPVVRVTLTSPMQVAQVFFLWEFATAVAGSVIGIDPFDQPDVEASKIETKKLTDAYAETGHLPDEAPFVAGDGMKLFADADNQDALRADTLDEVIRAHLDRAGPGDYVALLAYIDRNPATIEALTRLRTRIRDSKHVATCVGFGPRFLHSTGQAYKGGPNSGVVLQITADDAADLAVPGEKYSFGTVKAAQARGDFDVLSERGRRALRVHLGSDVQAGLARLAQAVEAAL